MSVNFTKIFFLLIGCSVLYTSNSHAQGNLLVTPRRVVLDGNKRTEEINLANTGRDTARYVISTSEMTMNEDGSFAALSDSTVQNAASPYIRFFPHTVTLAPNEAQLVKVQVTRYNQMQPGEYRSHLYFRAKAPETALGDTVVNNSKTISVSITPTFGISIPVIVRVGENKTIVALSHLDLNTKDTTPRISMIIHRDGNMSVYGDVVVDYVSKSGNITRVGFVRGIAVYTTINKRHFTLPLDADKHIDYHSGKLRVSFTENNSQAAKLAESEIDLN